MDLEALVKAITAEVLKQVNGREAIPSILIIGDPSCKKCQAAEKRLGKGHTVLYPDAEPGAEASLRRIVPYLSIRHMADMAVGKADGPSMEIVLAALLAGQPVEVMEFEYKRHADTAPEGMMRLFEGQEALLASFGLTAMEMNRSETHRIRKSLVTDADVAEAREKGARELRLPLATQMTPLAVENARELGITISRG